MIKYLNLSLLILFGLLAPLRRVLVFLLDAGARAYVNHPRGVRIDEQGQLIVSSIYHWYADDFGADAAGLIDHLRRHAGAALAAELQGVSNVHDHAYDWSLNDLR